VKRVTRFRLKIGSPWLHLSPFASRRAKHMKKHVFPADRRTRNKHFSKDEREAFRLMEAEEETEDLVEALFGFDDGVLT
jgi:hypothetical protein